MVRILYSNSVGASTQTRRFFVQPINNYIMKNDKFLNLNGKSIFFQHHDGKFWIAIKPICELLKVDYIQVFKNLKEDKILSQLLCDHTMVGADNRKRKMISLPEKYIYGWMFSLQSKSDELYKYKPVVHLEI